MAFGLLEKVEKLLPSVVLGKKVVEGAEAKATLFCFVGLRVLRPAPEN